VCLVAQLPPAPPSLGTPRLYAGRAEPRMRTHLRATSPAVKRGPPSLVCQHETKQRMRRCSFTDARATQGRIACPRTSLPIRCPRWRSASSRGRVTVAMCPRCPGASTTRRQDSLISHRGPGDTLLPADHDPARGNDLARVREARSPDTGSATAHCHYPEHEYPAQRSYETEEPATGHAVSPRALVRGPRWARGQRCRFGGARPKALPPAGRRSRSAHERKAGDAWFAE
jgi:hypothetical protein